MSDIGQPSLFIDEGGLICFALQPQVEAPFHDLQYPIFIFSMIVSLLRYLGNDPDLNPVSIDFAGSGRSPGLSQFFKAELVYQRPVSQMRFRQKDLARKILFSNPDLLKFLEQAAD